MTHPDYAVKVENLGKTYKLGKTQPRPSTLAETMIAGLRGKRSGAGSETLEALDDISFEIPRGEALGIVGRNGAGKSTLLKILTRVTAPSRGRLEFRGRMGSLLEVGTGFHPELTGRENIFLNGALLGMGRADIMRQFDAIVEFSGMERFLETPVKRYSSGMYVRLAFSVAAHLETEILAIDEVLAVGDAEFQRRSLEKMREAAASGRTVLYVSHMLNTVTDLCTSAIMLERGRLVHHGSVESTLDAYMASFQRHVQEQLDPDNREGSGGVRFEQVWMEDERFASGDRFDIHFSIPRALRSLPVSDYWVSAHIRDESGMTIAQCDSRLNGITFDSTVAHTSSLSVKNLWLKPGEYDIDVFLCQHADLVDVWEGACHFEVIPHVRYAANAPEDAMSSGVVFADFQYEVN